MAQRRWFHLSTITFRAALPAVERLHAAQHPGQDLPVLWNADSSACLICLDGASREWRAAQSWVADCLGIYARDDWPGAARALGIPAHATPPAPALPLAAAAALALAEGARSLGRRRRLGRALTPPAPAVARRGEAVARQRATPRSGRTG